MLQILASHPSQTPALSLFNPLFRPRRTAGSFDLDEHRFVPVFGYQVDLATDGAITASQNMIAAVLQILSRFGLALAPDIPELMPALAVNRP